MGRPIVDGDTFGIVVESVERACTHEGCAFQTRVTATGVVQSSSILLQLKTSDKPVNLRTVGVFSSEQDVRVEVIEAPTITDGTSAATIVNLNRLSGKVSGIALAATDPTSISGGTELENVRLAVASQVSIRDALFLGGDWEWILRPSTSYLFRMTNLDADAATLDMLIRWVELDQADL
jgi:hypothetical protein